MWEKLGGSPLLIHKQFSVEILVVSGGLDWVDEFFGFNELVAVSIHVVRLCHYGSHTGQQSSWQLGLVQTFIEKQRRTEMGQICICSPKSEAQASPLGKTFRWKHL